MTPAAPGPLARAPVRDRLAVALDTPDLDRAVRLAGLVRTHVGVAKVGLELYCAVGPTAVVTLADEGFSVFVDLKLHDIPTTVGRAARVLGGLPCSYVNFHAAGGAVMLRAGVEGLAEGATRAGRTPPIALAVTILTSEAATGDVLGERVDAALAAGCAGVVCAASDLGVVRQRGSTLLAAVPGIRPAGAVAHDQVRVATPAGALAAGADLLVVGRPLTGAADPGAAAASLRAEMEAAVGNGDSLPQPRGCDQPS
jgi:orotidine-5'-phosphate decarboxylase